MYSFVFTLFLISYRVVGSKGAADSQALMHARVMATPRDCTVASAVGDQSMILPSFSNDFPYLA
jgi:hypothetical protein